MARKKRKASEAGTSGVRAPKKKAKPTTSLPAGASVRATRGMTLNASRQAVFQTAELLEAILVLLPIKDIFLIQRVSRQFRDLVGSSIQIQQRLFMRQCAEYESWTARINEPQQGRWLPKYELLRVEEGVINALGEPFTPVTLCPILDPIRFGDPDGKGFVKRREVTVEMESLVAKPGSWKAAQLTDPPCKEATIEISFRPDEKSMDEFTSQSPMDLTSVDGITLGDLSTALINMNHPFVCLPRGPRETIWHSSIADILETFRDSSAEEGTHLVYLHVKTVLGGRLVMPSPSEWRQLARGAVDAESETQA